MLGCSTSLGLAIHSTATGLIIYDTSARDYQSNTCDDVTYTRGCARASPEWKPDLHHWVVVQTVWAPSGGFSNHECVRSPHSLGHNTSTYTPTYNRPWTSGQSSRCRRGARLGKSGRELHKLQQCRRWQQMWALLQKDVWKRVRMFRRKNKEVYSIEGNTRKK